MKRGILSFFRLFKERVESNSKLVVRNVALIIAIFICVFLAISLVTFFVLRKGPPEVAVPKVTNKDLIEGLIILQKKNLRALIDPRYFSDQPKNTIVEQMPKAGSIVREKKDIKLIVSKGPIISIVEDYMGMTITFVQNRLQEIFSFQGKTIRIGNVTYVASEYTEGTIVGQYPPPNTPITNVETIDLIISKGREIHAFQLKDYTGQKVEDVMQLLALRGVLVHIITEEVLDPSMNGIIISQEPAAATVVKRNETVTFLVGYLPSEEEKEKLFARVLNFDVPDDIEEADVRIVVKDRISEREIYNAENVGGDSISVPFKSYSNTIVYIYVDNGLFEMRTME
ncbi:MAG TPA: PASTA domain-containing protein [Spirochaetota bacterium]|nr:PASTA domain-containing protein [Spirochaetota bacterium]